MRQRRNKTVAGGYKPESLRLAVKVMYRCQETNSIMAKTVTRVSRGAGDGQAYRQSIPQG